MKPLLPDVAKLYRDHADFVWRLLSRFGVREAELPDALQEVFLVVHRRRDSFDGTSAVTTWLYGIALRVASDFRHKAARRREELGVDEGELGLLAQGTPETDLAERRARERAINALEAMSEEHRLVFVLYELEGLSCEKIAALMDAPLGTIYSRLHYARRTFLDALQRPHD